MTAKHKILQVTASYYPSVVYGGPTVSINNLCKALVASGQEVLVITTTANGKNELNVKTQELQIVNGVPVIYFKRMSKDHTHFSPALLKYLWKNIHDFEIVHIHSWWNLVSVLSVIVCYLRRKKFVLSTRGTLNEFSFKKAFIRRIFIRFCNFTFFRNAVFHVTSQKEYIEVKNAVKKTPIVIPNIISFSEENLVKINASKIFNLIYLGRLHPIKNLNILLDSLKTVEFDFNLHIVGDGKLDYVNQLKNQALTNKLYDKCIWYGAIDNESEKNKLLLNADLLVLLSSTENFANVVIESLSVGTPVVVSTGVGLSNFIAENDLGWVVDFKGIHITDTLNKAVRDFEKRNLIRQLAPLKIRSEFGKEILIQKYSSLYDSIVS